MVAASNGVTVWNKSVTASRHLSHSTAGAIVVNTLEQMVHVCSLTEVDSMTR